MLESRTEIFLFGQNQEGMNWFVNKIVLLKSSPFKNLTQQMISSFNLINK